MYFPLEAVALVPVLALAAIAVRARSVPVVAALALIFAAFATKLQPFALHTFLWAHLLQNVVLAEWAPALLVLAVPSAAVARARGFPLFRPLVALPLWLVTYFRGTFRGSTTSRCAIRTRCCTSSTSRTSSPESVCGGPSCTGASRRRESAFS